MYSYSYPIVKILPIPKSVPEIFARKIDADVMNKALPSAFSVMAKGMTKRETLLSIPFFISQAFSISGMATELSKKTRKSES